MVGRVGQVRAFVRERSDQQLRRSPPPLVTLGLPQGYAQNSWETTGTAQVTQG
jgi:hypothetical protein